ncbi:carboxyltransferase [Amycolatopsis echigonensis]|uniref:Carboxyltransferase n=1 Tax=Amycolatopsis echigonensis TaxID=2576905 RepID=A0A8E1W1I6_9PSEU|nr:carboxyltransferase [Amycolatopsis echigonensis]MBB2502360.1 carboxyltransferase [Amycolatopsis echigonensis]
MHIDFVEQSVRDGQQSLWGMRMRAFEAAPALPYLKRGGYRTIDLTGAGMFTVLLREYHDDPWGTLDFLVAGLGGNELRSGLRTISCVGFAPTPQAILDLWIATLIKHGSTSFWLYDCLYDMDIMRHMADVVAKAGGQPVPAVMYGLTDVHDDAFFAERAGQMASWPGVESVYLEDAAGVLKPERAKTLLPAIRAATGDIPLEMHAHNTTGLAQHNYIVAMESGFTRLHTASRPLANGPSLPSTEMMSVIVEHLGHTHGLDTSTFAPVAEAFERAARLGGHPIGVPAEYDPRIYDHQLPGGMTGTLINQLERHGMGHRLPEVLEAIPQVRVDLGSPIMATPFSQFVGIQAVLNIVTGKPYEMVPDEVVHYALGHYGPLPAPIAPGVLDRILSSPRARQLESWERPDPSLTEIRKRFPRGISDEELLLRFMFSDEEVDQTIAKGPVRTDPRRSANSIVEAITDLIADPGHSRSFSVSTPDFSLKLRKES